MVHKNILPGDYVTLRTSTYLYDQVDVFLPSPRVKLPENYRLLILSVHRLHPAAGPDALSLYTLSSAGLGWIIVDVAYGYDVFSEIAR